MTPDRGFRPCATMGCPPTTMRRQPQQEVDRCWTSTTVRISPLAQRLAARADIVVQNFKPDGLRRFGLDYHTVAVANPAVVYCSISGFGTQSRCRIAGLRPHRAGHVGPDEPDRRPARPAVPVRHERGRRHGRTALDHRHPGRRCVTATPPAQGQHVETNLMSSAMSGLVNQTSAYVAGGVNPHRMGNAHPSLFPYEPLPTADGELIIAAGNVTQFRRLVAGARRPRTRRRSPVRHQRRPHRKSGRAARHCWWSVSTSQPSRYWFERLNAAGVPQRTDQHDRSRCRVRPGARLAPRGRLDAPTTGCRCTQPDHLLGHRPPLRTRPTGAR